MKRNDVSEQVCFDKNIKGIDPDSVGKVALPDGTVMPIAAFGTFHSDWAQAYMKDATVEAVRIPYSSTTNLCVSLYLPISALMK